MSKLYIIPSPIGNLEDMTFRAVRILKEVQLILAEDTRQTSKLLMHYGIQNRMMSFHQHNEHQSIRRIVDTLHSGTNVGLISDAGTPGISDPAFLLVRACVEQEIEVECLPGPTAFVPALVQSGFPTSRFIFEGFLPHKKGRQKRLKALTEDTRTLVFYESPFRLIKALEEFRIYFGENRPIAVCREISKLFHETRRGNAPELISYYTAHPPKGEIVLLVSGKTENEEATFTGSKV